MKRKYVLVSIEVWQVDETNDHSVVARRETEIDLPQRVRLADVTDTVQRSAANMVELLKDYLTFTRN